jgi:hypothetical protein
VVVRGWETGNKEFLIDGHRATILEHENSRDGWWFYNIMNIFNATEIVKTINSNMCV